MQHLAAGMRHALVAILRARPGSAQFAPRTLGPTLAPFRHPAGDATSAPPPGRPAQRGPQG
eukprot:324530-Lingulodinium_polyedra.AAC.1